MAFINRRAVDLVGGFFCCFFLTISQWICDISPQGGLHIPEVNFHRPLQICKRANIEMFGQPLRWLPDHTPVCNLVSKARPRYK